MPLLSSVPNLPPEGLRATAASSPGGGGGAPRKVFALCRSASSICCCIWISCFSSSACFSSISDSFVFCLCRASRRCARSASMSLSLAASLSSSVFSPGPEGWGKGAKLATAAPRGASVPTGGFWELGSLGRGPPAASLDAPSCGRGRRSGDERGVPRGSEATGAAAPWPSVGVGGDGDRPATVLFVPLFSHATPRVSSAEMRFAWSGSTIFLQRLRASSEKRGMAPPKFPRPKKPLLALGSRKSISPFSSRLSSRCPRSFRKGCLPPNMTMYIDTPAAHTSTGKL
mmetsp:Transcript_61030/g.164595  ORF Transcript_61030/g.164595 Transcript_61030/m.164595 type:complete len:286 (-) Transcript_61030:587-1444(-)